MARFQYLLSIGVIPLFFLWRFFDFLIAYFSTFFISYSGNFSHPTTLAPYALPHWIKGFAQFDGIFYLRIAQNGYSQFEQAFFPLFPLFIKVLSQIFGGNHLILSLILANLSFLIGLIVFRKYLELILPVKYRNHIQFVIVALLLYPTSFFFGSVYTEGLFFLLVISTFYFLHKKNFWLVALFAYLASLTRFIGVFLFIPILIDEYRISNIIYRFKTKFLVAASPILGLATYMYYLWSSTGNPLAFFTSQTAFGAGRSTQLIFFPQVIFRYLKIILTTPVNIGYFVALLELGIFLFVFTILVMQLKDLIRSKDKKLLGLNLFSMANLLIPTFTGTFLSIPRFSLLSLSFFVYLGLLKNTTLKVLICFILFIIHVALVTLFIQGYFVS